MPAHLSYRRGTAQEGTVKADGRPDAARPTPANALSEEERQKRITLSCPPEFARLPPPQIVPLLANRGECYASESSFYRGWLKAHDLQYCRVAGAVLGTYFSLYRMLDLFSRKVVGWEVHEEGSAEHAS